MRAQLDDSMVGLYGMNDFFIFIALTQKVIELIISEIYR